jgi:hypothetical protein
LQDDANGVFKKLKINVVGVSKSNTVVMSINCLTGTFISFSARISQSKRANKLKLKAKAKASLQRQQTSMI